MDLNKLYKEIEEAEVSLNAKRLKYIDVCDWREVFGKYGDRQHSLIDALHKLISEYVEWKDLLSYFKKGKIDGYRLRYDNRTY